MADRASAHITIGGTLARSLFSDFLAAISADNLCIDYGDRVVEEADILSGRTFFGMASDVIGAQFEETEAFCRLHGLRYIRRSDARADAWDPSVEIFSGAGATLGFGTTSEGAVVLTLAEIRSLGSLAAIEAHCRAADGDTGPLLIADDIDAPPAGGG
jgi:hypothetical protein